jgi:hypothetical protein
MQPHTPMRLANAGLGCVLYERPAPRSAAGNRRCGGVAGTDEAIVGEVREMTTDARTFESPLHRQIVYWRIRQQLKHGVTSREDLAAAFGYSVRMISHIAKHATPPDFHGLDEATALRASAAAVPVATAAYLIRTHATATIEEQARHLACTPHRVRKMRSLLYRAELLDPAQSRDMRQRRKARDGHLVSRVRDLTAKGWSQAAVADALHQPLGRVEGIVHSLGGASALRTDDGLSLCQAAHLMGVKDDAVRCWVNRGWLAVTRNPGGRNTMFRVSRIALRAFVRCRAAWPSLSVSTIRDVELRELARVARATAGGQWRSRKELALACAVDESTIHDWIANGWLADWETTTYSKSIFHWQRDGATLVPPPNARRRI